MTVVFISRPCMNEVLEIDAKDQTEKSEAKQSAQESLPLLRVGKRRGEVGAKVFRLRCNG